MVEDSKSVSNNFEQQILYDLKSDNKISLRLKDNSKFGKNWPIFNWIRQILDFFDGLGPFSITICPFLIKIQLRCQKSSKSIKKLFFLTIFE